MLDLSHNQLTSLPVTIGQLSSLTILDFSHNFIKALPEEIGCLSQLTTFIGSYNNLSQIPSSIGNLASLRSIHLNGNKLRNLPWELSKCENLTDIYCEANSLKEIPEELTKLQHLRHINISNNDLESLPLLPFISKVKVTFHDNPNVTQVPFIFGSQQNQLKSWIKLNPLLQAELADAYFWQFAIRGCFQSQSQAEETSNSKSCLHGLKILRKTPPSLLEQSLRAVYGACFDPEVIETHCGGFQRCPRVLKRFGKWVLFSQEEPKLPKILLDLLTVGPKTFCCHCLRSLFTETYVQEAYVHLQTKYRV